MNQKWYALQVQARKEESLKKTIEDVFVQHQIQDCLGRIHAPFHRYYAVRKGKREVQKSYFSYLFVELDLQPKVKELLLRIEGVLGFVTPTGWSRREEPMPVSESEMQQMVGSEKQKNITKQLDGFLHKGDEIEIVDGVFQGNTAIVERNDSKNKKVEVFIKIFQKETKVELTYNQVRKK